MRFLIIIELLLILLCVSCHRHKKKINPIDNGFEKSYKEDKGKGFNEHLDSMTNIYSNFKYHIAFDAPDKWNIDYGVSEHTIFRTFQKDSSITFSINVIDMNLKDDKVNSYKDVWEFYQNNKEQLDAPIISSIQTQMNTTVKGFKAKKTYIKNNICLKRSYYYRIRNFDLEYDIYTIQYQTFINDWSLTFTLSIPKIFYDDNSDYWEMFFDNIYFLKNSEILEKQIKNIKTVA